MSRVASAIVLAALVALGALAPAVANHLPQKCFGGPGSGQVGFSRNDPECSFGPCVHHPPDAPADEKCFQDCDGLERKLAAAKELLARFEEEYGDILREIEQLGRELLAEEQRWAPRIQRAEDLLDRLGTPITYSTGETGSDPSSIPERWRRLLMSFGFISLYDEFPVLPIEPMTDEDRAWAEERGALDELLALEEYLDDIERLSQEMADLWDEQDDLEGTITMLTMAAAIAAGDVESLEEQLRRCQAAQAQST